MNAESKNQPPLPAVVLAGGINRIALEEGYRPALKGLIPFGGKSSIARVLRALRGASRIGEIAVVGSKEALGPGLEDDEALELLPPGTTLLGSLRTGLRHFQGADRVLVTTADLPLLDAATVEAFLDACRRRQQGRTSELCWAMVPETCFTGPFVQSEKGYNRFRDVSVCHGNLLLIDPDIVDEFTARTPLEALYRARKSSLRCAAVCGWRVGLAYLIGVLLFRRLSLEQMASLVSERFRIKIDPVLVCRPEAALDVDEPADYRLVQQILDTGRPDGQGSR